MNTYSQGLKWVMSADTTKLHGSLKAAARAFQETGDAAEKSTSQMKGSISTTNNAANAFKKLGKAALAFVGFRQVAKFTANAIAAGEQMDKLRVTSDRVFKDMSLVTQTWASEVAGSYGMAEREALTFTNRIGGMLNAIGFQDAKLSAMTLNLSKFAGELAYINNLSTDQALSAVQSALTGDGEALRRLGYNLSAVSIQEYMYQQGLDISFRKLNARSQALIRHNYLMSQSSKITGLASEMTNTWSGQTTQLKRSWDTFKTSIGEVLTVVLVPMFKVVNSIMSALAGAAQAAMVLVRTLFGVKPKALGVTKNDNVGENLAAGFNNATGAAKKTRKEVRKLLGIDELNILPDDPDPSSGSGAANAGGIDLDLGVDTTELEKANSLTDEFRAKWEAVANGFKINKVPIISVLAAIGAGLAALFVVNNIGAWSAAIAGAVLWVKQFFAAVQNWGLLKTIFTGIGQAVGGRAWPITAVIAVIMAVAGALAQLWQTNEEFRGKVTSAWESIKQLFSVIWDSVLEPILTSLGNMFRDIWDHALKPLWDGWVEFVKSVSMHMMTLWDDVLAPVFTWITATFGPYISAIFDLLSRNISFAMSVIGQIIGTVFKNISVVVDGFTGVLQGVITFIKGVFTGDWSMAWEGVRKIFDSIIGSFKGIFKNAWDFILGIFNTGGKIFDGVVDGIVSTFKTVVNGLIGGINKVIAIPFNAINGLLNSIRGASFLGISPFKGLWKQNPLWVPQIPKFADGGMVYGTTLGIMGEYAGARSNPEVIAPLDRLQAILHNGDGISAEQVERIIRLLTSILDKDSNTYLDRRKISKVLDDAKNVRNRQLGYT